MPSAVDPGVGTNRSRLVPRRASVWAVLAVLESVVSAAAATSGTLLVLAPNGGLLDADPGALASGPFHSWRLPGLLLITLVGGGFAAAALSVHRRDRAARALSFVAGTGLIAFEAVEIAWIGFQPLEIVFMVVGLAVVLLAARLPA